MAFRIGRKYASETYPETGGARGGAAGVALARNFGVGPKTPTSIGGGLQIEWNSLDAGPSPSVDVLITPKVSGLVLVTGVVAVTNSTGAAIVLGIQVQVDGPPVGALLGATVPAHGSLTVPFMVETTELDTPVGVQSNVNVFVTGNGLTLAPESSLCSAQEVTVASG